MQRSVIERTRGALRRENAGISSEKEVRNLFTVSLRIPGGEGSSAQGKPGPKPRRITRRRWTIG